MAARGPGVLLAPPYGERPMQLNVSRFSAAQLAAAAHQHELAPEPCVHVHLDTAHAGLGGDDSWSRSTHEAHVLRTGGPPWEFALALRALAEAHGSRLLHETTVGAGLPVLDSYAKRVETGDTVLRIEGCTSGTLGFLLTEIGKGRAFSEALRDAMTRGFTEPDPRDDLSGMDVARKALILARMMGFAGDLADVTVESLVPTAYRAMPLPKFLASLAQQDAAWADRFAAAATQGRVLRYVLNATARTVKVGLCADRESFVLSTTGEPLTCVQR
jgi:hypothetical protein